MYATSSSLSIEAAISLVRSVKYAGPLEGLPYSAAILIPSPVALTSFVCIMASSGVREKCGALR